MVSITALGGLSALELQSQTEDEYSMAVNEGVQSKPLEHVDSVCQSLNEVRKSLHDFYYRDHNGEPNFTEFLDIVGAQSFLDRDVMTALIIDADQLFSDTIKLHAIEFFETMFDKMDEKINNCKSQIMERLAVKNGKVVVPDPEPTFDELVNMDMHDHARATLNTMLSNL